jgi:hypothetical protein
MDLPKLDQVGINTGYVTFYEVYELQCSLQVDIFLYETRTEIQA